MPYVIRRVCQCSRCGHEWLPKSPPGRKGKRLNPQLSPPARCAKCKDPNWDKPRKYKLSKRPRRVRAPETADEMFTRFLKENPHARRQPD